MVPADRPTSFWLRLLRQRKARMYEEKLDLSTPIVWESEEERTAAIAFFNAAFRAEESGLRQAHEIAGEVESWDPELAETLRLYGDEEGWHRELLTEFLAYIGGEVRPMGPTTSTFYKLYARAERHETIVLTNLMFETIGATTYRLALRTAKQHPAIRQMLTILTRDESFHVPLNVHFLRRILAREKELGQRTAARRLRPLYHGLTAALMASAAASRRRAKRFDNIPFKTLSRAYAEHLGRLFLHADDFGLRPSRMLLATVGLRRADLRGHDDVLSVDAAERAADRTKVVVDAL
ncbi:MAG: ferritin-like domain-containing protein [Deltaproteobacteria bacterium]|nr:ferritin-like domain-containing protein [Deltaproteobacteria bacterium]